MKRRIAHQILSFIFLLAAVLAPASLRAQTSSQTPAATDTAGVACSPNGALSYNGNSFVVCTSGVWIVEPVTIGAGGTCSSSIYGQLEWTGSAVEVCTSSGWSSIAASGITGSGTTNYLARWTPNGSTLGIGALYDNGTDVGIGTTGPQSTLSVSGGVAIGTTFAGTNAAGSNNLIVQGSVGIGTTTGILTKLDVRNSFDIANTDFVSGSAGSGMLFSTGANSGTTYALIQSYSAGVAGGDLILHSSAGFVGIGTTSPGEPLHVYTSTTGAIAARFQNGTGYCNLTPASAGSPTWSCVSDARLKKDIVDTGDVLAWLGDMRIRDFTMKADGSRLTGVIAQEMMLTHPDMVHVASDGYYTVDGPGLWKMIKAIQELKSLFDGDHGAIEKLKAENDNLRTELKAANDNFRNETGELRREIVNVKESRAR